MKRILSVVCFMFVSAGCLWAEEKIDVFPQTPYDRSAIYLNLGLFWIIIVGLIVLIRLKLKETERVQKMEQAEENRRTPLLE